MKEINEELDILDQYMKELDLIEQQDLIKRENQSDCHIEINNMETNNKNNYMKITGSALVGGVIFGGIGVVFGLIPCVIGVVLGSGGACITSYKLLNQSN